MIRDSATSDSAAPTIADAADVLRVWPAPAGSPTVGTAPAAAWVRFLPRGNAVSAAGSMPVTYTMKVYGCSNEQGRTIEVNAIGRTTVSRIACP